MHREVPVRLGKERWETHTATVVQGAHRLLHLPCGFDYQLLSAINQSLILLRPVLRFFSLKSAFYSFPACGQLHRGQSAQAQQYKAQPEPGIADVTDFGIDFGSGVLVDSTSWSISSPAIVLGKDLAASR